MSLRLKSSVNDSVLWRKAGLSRPAPRTIVELQAALFLLNLPPTKDKDKVILPL